jgi:hypothetical protein
MKIITIIAEQVPPRRCPPHCWISAEAADLFAAPAATLAASA